MRQRVLLMSVFALLLPLCFIPTQAQSSVCDGKGVCCYECPEYAFRIKLDGKFVQPDADTRKSALNYDPWLRSLIEYMAEHPYDVYYRSAVIPLPAAHGVSIPWNAGLLLKSGEIVMANKWLVHVGDIMPLELDDPGFVQLTYLQEVSSNGDKGFIMVIAFPNRTPSGAEWKEKQVTGLVIQK